MTSDQENYRTFIRSIGFILLGGAFVGSIIGGNVAGVAALGPVMGFLMKWYYPDNE